MPGTDDAAAYCDHAGSLQELAGLNRTETAGPHPGRFAFGFSRR